MKKLFCITILIMVLYACKKEDRDEMFKSRTHRYLTGFWDVEKVIINDVDLTSSLVNNDSLCNRWHFIYMSKIFQQYETSKLYLFSNSKNYTSGYWKLIDNDRYVYLYMGYSLRPDTNIVNRWIECGDWLIKEISKTNMTLVFQNDNVKFEYQFKKYKED
jgi:hypothetical protein